MNPYRPIAYRPRVRRFDCPTASRAPVPSLAAQTNTVAAPLRSSAAPRAAILCLAALAIAPVIGCGASLPNRYVVERDIDGLEYRRYQKVLDVEFPVENNPGVGHTASYVRRGGDQEVRFATAFVTVYRRPAGLVAEVRARLDTLGTYDIEVAELAGENVWMLDGGGDKWSVWVSGRHVIKLGAPRGEDIPEDLAEEYLDLYPSDLDEHGRARAGAASAGRAQRDDDDEDDDGELGLPRHLREGAPQ